MKRLNTRIPQIICFLTLVLFITSCSNEGVSPTEDYGDASIYELISESSVNSTAKGAPKKGSDPIAGIAINAQFNELVKALVYVDEELDAGLVNLFLNGTDQFTVFAPTDLAFMNLYEALDISGIRDLDASLVLSVLKYHVTTGRRASNSVVPKNGMRTIETLLGVTFDVYPDLSIMAVGNSANIETADISASNGIIHIIDTVILPIE